MKLTAPLSYDGGIEQVEHMMGQGVPFEEIEDAIDSAPLSTDHKAALWLLAWSLRDPMHQHRDARLTLQFVTTGRLGGG